MVENRRNIVFNEGDHTYIDEYNKNYTSVTTVVSQYHEQFNTEYWAGEIARQSGLTKEAVKQNWKDITDFACDKGNKVHKQLENSINESNGNSSLDFINVREPNWKTLGFKLHITNANILLLESTILAKKYPSIYTFIKEKIQDGWYLYAEKRIYWADFLIAGTIDCLLVKGKDFIIVDWKTNKDELKFESGYYKKDPTTRVKTNIWIPKKVYFFSPIGSLEDCKGNRYTMQLSLYAYLMEMWGYRCTGLYLYHIREEKEPKLYIISYLDWACKILCTDFKSRLTFTSLNISDLKSSEDFSIT